MKRQPQSRRSIFAAPLLVAVVSIVGLVAALTGDGMRDAVSWVALGLPIAVIGWAMARRRT